MGLLWYSDPNDERNTMKHLDFTKVIIVVEDGSRIDIVRVDPWFVGDNGCECCGEPAEYKLTSDWDPLHQCDVYECQGCLISGMAAPDSPDTYIFVAA